MRKRGCIRQLGQAADARPQPKGLAPRHCLLPTLMSSERGIRSGKERACNRKTGLCDPANLRNSGLNKAQQDVSEP